jgi:hypothetical protein
MDKNKIFKTGKALLFITSGLLLSDACFAAAPARPRAARVDWTKDEDARLIDLVATHGEGKWAKIAKGIPGRTGHQCQQRWTEVLAPWINKDPWTLEEDNRLIELHGELGNAWTAIVRWLNTGRTLQNIRHHCERHLKDRAPQSQAQPAKQTPHFPARIIDLLN